jgi:hypothetical protein
VWANLNRHVKVNFPTAMSSGTDVVILAPTLSALDTVGKGRALRPAARLGSRALPVAIDAAIHGLQYAAMVGTD